ncbi:hypothetical protein [Hyphomicrobium sp.]|uniref:hypothetical protein n=1 Tax=Hyphomicrobium sp. TaxID=82 RepID=UPI0025C6E8E1|nr:hypothetical protein [Hyphomicrobium sp.]MCC7253855.1 hypothetical protein [Hyphomicrobium sp.]
MRSILRDDVGPKGTRALLALAPISDGEAAAQSAPAPEAGRHRYVVGVFVMPGGAESAIAGVASDACEVLVVSDTAPVQAARAAIESGERVTFHRIDTSGALAGELAAALGTLRPFAALGLSAGEELSGMRLPNGGQRLFQNLVHHMATGAAVVIVHAPGPEEQHRVSRALLDAKCDILLTHDVLHPTSCDTTASAPPGDCCETCSSRSCGRIDPSQNGTSTSRPDD